MTFFGMRLFLSLSCVFEEQKSRRGREFMNRCRSPRKIMTVWMLIKLRPLSPPTKSLNNSGWE